MTTKIGDVVVLEDEPDKHCTRCNNLTDCRDILFDGNQVCFDCATEEEKNKYVERLFRVTN